MSAAAKKKKSSNTKKSSTTKKSTNEKVNNNENLENQTSEVKKETKSSNKKTSTPKEKVENAETKKSNTSKKKTEGSDENKAIKKNTTKSKKNTDKNEDSKKSSVSEDKKEVSEKDKLENVSDKSETKKSTSKKTSSKTKKSSSTKKKTSTASKTTKKQTKKSITEKEDVVENEIAENSNKKKTGKSKKENKVSNEEEKLDSKENKEENVEKVEKKESLNPNEKPDYVKKMLKNRKIKMFFIALVILFILLILGFSICFSLLNMDSNNFTKGVKIRNIDVSELTLDEAREKINSSINSELVPEIELKYGEEYKITLSPEQIEYKYNVEEALLKGYDVGRSGNIFVNNYTLLLTPFFEKNIDVNYMYNEEFLNNFIDDINSKIPGIVVEPNYYIEEDELIISKGKDGIQVDKEKLKSTILEAISSRDINEVLKEDYKQIIDIPVIDVKASLIDIDKIYNEIHREPQDAYYETDPYKIYADVDGIDFNVSVDEAKNIITSEEKDEYTIPLKITKAGKTINDLGTEAFPYLISSFSTKYDASNRNRSTNLEIAAEKINGKVLMPGEIFSFNKVVGKRTVEDGYKDAKIYADGGVVDGLAGGICQISSTLYNTVLLANLEIVERRNHSYTTSYVAAGRDATVVYGAIDFQFKNSRSYPIKIEASVKNGIAEFKMHGMPEENEYEIRILPVTTQSIPYGTSYIDDPTLAPGRQVVVQAGHAGYKVTTSIEKRLNGTVVSKEVISNDTYNPMKTIIRRGPVAVPTEAAPVPVETPVQ